MHLSFSTNLVLAEEGSGSPAAPEAGPFGNILFLLPILFILFWLFLLRPGQKRREREQQALVASLNKNDKIMTNAGILGVVHSVQDDEVVVKLEDNAKMRIIRTAVVRNISAEERQKATAANAATTTAKPEEAIKEQKA